MTLTPAYWIAPDGERLEVERSHIAAVIADPARFGVTEAWLRARYAEHGEGDRFGCEGHAREAIIRRIVMAGWIRTRRYIRPATYWSVTVDELDNATWRNLATWAIAGLEEGRLKPTTELRIHEIAEGHTTTTEVSALSASA